MSAIIGIGTDIIEIERVQKACVSENFCQKTFTAKELAYASAKGLSRMATLAACFAGKEAVAKCLGTGFRGFRPIHVEILRDALGKPYVILYGRALEIAREKGIIAWHISLSHCQETAIAFAMAEGNGLSERIF